MKDGTYAFRFGGFVTRDDAFRRAVPYHLVGIGTLTLNAGKVSGFQSSTATALAGAGAKVLHTKYKLKGTYEALPGNADLHKATIDLTLVESLDIPSQNLTAEFNFRPIGEDRLWLISTTTRDNTADADANEVVSGEAVLVS